MTEPEYAPAHSSFLMVGLPLQLVMGSGQSKVNCVSTLLGWKERTWLICEWPFHLGHAVSCEAGTRCLVRYLIDGKLIGYESEVRTTQTSPVPLLYLAFPQTVEEVHLRKHVRVPSNEPLLLIPADGRGAAHAASKGNAPMGGLVQDLSVAGCRVALYQSHPSVLQGSTVQLEFELIGVGHVSNLTGVIRNVAEHEKTKSIGIEFRFGGKEYIEYRGWGGSVQKAIEYAVLQRQHVPGVAPVPLYDSPSQQDIKTVHRREDG
jgi:c-di-GMP-binding flagellar brake protein YcgR